VRADAPTGGQMGMSPPTCPLASAVLNDRALLDLQGQSNPPLPIAVADFLCKRQRFAVIEL